MAISATNEEYMYARKRADETLHRSFHATTSEASVAMSASEASSAQSQGGSSRRSSGAMALDPDNFPYPVRFLSPALCSTSNYFFTRKDETIVSNPALAAVAARLKSHSFDGKFSHGDGNVGMGMGMGIGTSIGMGMHVEESPGSLSLGRPFSAQPSPSDSMETTSTFAEAINQHLQRIHEDYDIPTNRPAMAVSNPFHSSSRRYPITPRNSRRKTTKNQDHMDTVSRLSNIIFQSKPQRNNVNTGQITDMEMNDGPTASTSIKQNDADINTITVCVPVGTPQNPILTPHDQFKNFGSTLPKKVCQHPFKRNDIVWVCRTCQADETCVLCHKCFNASQHENHDVAFYHAQAGGCCDCGDPDAWDPAGFCPLHGKDLNVVLEKGLECRLRGVVDYCAEFLHGYAQDVERGYKRTYGTVGVYENVTVNSAKRKFGRSMSDGDGVGDTDEDVDEDADGIGTEDNIVPGADNSDGGRNLHRADTAPNIQSHPDGSQANPSISSFEAMDTSNQSIEPSLLDQNMEGEDDVEAATNIAAAALPTPVSTPPLTPSAVDGECKFDPAAASASKSRLNRSLHSNDSLFGSDSNNNDDGGGKRDEKGAKEEFDPEAASTSKSQLRAKKYTVPDNMTPAQHLGLLGLQQEGLFLLLHADDVHKTLDITSAIRTLYHSYPRPHSERTLDSISNKVADLFQHDIGDLIIWGTHELMDELGPVLSSCWKDGDATACTRFGALMLEKARIFTRVGMVVSIKTREELCQEIRCAAVLELLNLMSDCCDPFCKLVSIGLGAKDDREDSEDEIEEDGDTKMENDLLSSAKHSKIRASSSSHLISMLQTDLKLPRKISKSWHDLLLTLLAVPNFKAALANAYVDSYSAVTREYAQGVGIFDKSSYTLSVQFLNRVTYVEDLVKERDLLGCLVRSLFATLSVATKSNKNTLDGHMARIGTLTRSSAWSINMIHDVLDDYLNPLGPRVPTAWGFRKEDRIESGRTSETRLNPVLDPLHPILSHRRYGPCVGDLKCVLNVPGVARLFSSLPKSIAPVSPFKKRCLLDAWIDTLSLLQNMDGQRWRRADQGHVEQEPRDWVGAFNAGIAIGSLYERILSWEDNGENVDSSLFRTFKKSNNFLSLEELTEYILVKGIDSWQSAESLGFTPTTNGPIPEYNCPVCLPMSTVAADNNAPMAMKALPVAQSQLWSFHLPLHRFVAACLREISRRPYKQRSGEPGGLDQLVASLKKGQNARRLFRIYLGLLDYPTIILARNSQIRSQLWLRNGKLMFDQVLNYGEPHFCKGLRDSDLSLIQFAFIGLSGISQADLDAATSKNENLYRKFTCAHFINLLLHRFGVFEFAGFCNAAVSYEERYWEEVEKGYYPAEKQMSTETKSLPWCYSATDDPERHKSMLEEFLYTLIILVTELFAPPPIDHKDHALQAKARLRREVLHRLASGPKAHSELAEVHHVLPMRDNMILSEEGKCVNPDDATGAALEAALVDIADCKSFRGKSDEWELQRWAWNEYDPAFFHLSLRQHQNASEFRPNGLDSKDRRITPMPYAPFPPPAHKTFLRMRRDVTSDVCVRATLYRSLHAHCRDRGVDDLFLEKLDPLQQEAYNVEALSETIIGRVIHLLTMGVYSWEGANADENWREGGGLDVGSVFRDFNKIPTQTDWVQKILLAEPAILMSSSVYANEQNTLQLLQVLVSNGGSEQFKVQDRSIRGGAAWLCEYATRHSKEAANVLGGSDNSKKTKGLHDSFEADKQRRSREAKQRAMKMFKNRMTEFAKTIEINDDSDHTVIPQSPMPKDIIDVDFRETPKTADSKIDVHHDENDLDGPIIPALQVAPNTSSVVDAASHESISRLFRERPRCIICADDGTSSQNLKAFGKDHTAIKPKKNILALYGYIQASTVARVGGGEPPSNIPKTEYLVGSHVTLCGHAVHVSCCESHLKDYGLDRYLDRNESSKRADFRCPLCRNLSNCLIPFQDVGQGWAFSNSETKEAEGDLCTTLHDFLHKSKWWATRNDSLFVWNGRCSFLPRDLNAAGGQPSNPKTKSYGKKDLCRAWSTVLWTPPNVGTGRGLQHNLGNSDERSVAQSHSSAGVAVVWRRILDQISDISYKADIKRIGEGNRFYGEFRHHLVEKLAYNEENDSPSTPENSDWPSCMIPYPSHERRQALSREKLISKQLLSIQALTYTCCSEILECIRLARECTSTSLGTILTKFGINRFVFDGRFVILSTPSIDDTTQIFDGRIGRLRYFALPVLVATSPLAREVVHLCMDLPVPIHSFTPSDDNIAKRAEIVCPILCGNILTRIVAAMCAACGQERARSEAMGTAQSFMASLVQNLGQVAEDTALQDCLNFIQLGFVARAVQVLLGVFQQEFSRGVAKDCTTFEQYLMMIERSLLPGRDLNSNWERGCALLLQAVVSQQSISSTETQSNGLALFSKACQIAKSCCVEYICNIGGILQIILPKSILLFKNIEGPRKEGADDVDNFLDVFGVRDFESLIDSPLVLTDIVVHWYERARPEVISTSLDARLDCSRTFQVYDWPHLHTSERPLIQDTKLPPGRLPLLHGDLSFDNIGTEDKSRITSLPTSYTDLYATLSSMLPDSELTAVCLVCGKVLNAGGKGECTKHSFACGGGCGIFFLLQECICLGIHKENAVYITSPYVDSHGETPQYRGRPLNMEKTRYDFLHGLWSGHLLRAHVISERSKCPRHRLIANNYY